MAKKNSCNKEVLNTTSDNIWIFSYFIFNFVHLLQLGFNSFVTNDPRSEKLPMIPALDASNPMVDIRVLALITYFLEILFKGSGESDKTQQNNILQNWVCCVFLAFGL